MLENVPHFQVILPVQEFDKKLSLVISFEKCQTWSHPKGVPHTFGN